MRPLLPYLRSGYRTVFLILLMSFAKCLSGQLPMDTSNFRYQKINLLDKYNVGIAFSMVQDKLGFLWLGTNVGLFRYDGGTYKQYRYVPGKVNTLANELVSSLEVNDDYLFIGTQTGLSILDFKTDSIINFHAGNSNPNTPEGFRIASLLWYKEKLWILGNNFTLTSYDPSTKAFQRYNLPKPRVDAEDYIVFDLKKLVVDKTDSNSIWICSTYGLYKFSINNNAVKLISPPGKGYFNTQNQYGMTMVQGQDGLLWIGGVIQKLISYHPGKNEWNEYGYEPTVRSDSNVTSIYNLHFIDSRYILLFTALARFQYLFDTKQKQFLPMTDPNRRAGRMELVYDGAARFIYADRNSNIWFGHGEGYSRIITQRDPFKAYRYWFDGKRPKNNNFQLAFLEDVQHNRLFIGTRNGDGFLIRTFKPDSLIMVHSSSWVDTSKYDIPVEDLLLDNSGVLWLATPRGLFIWRDGWDRFYPYENQLVNYHIHTMIHDKNGNLLMGTRENGLIALDPRSKQVKTDYHSIVPFRHIRCLLIDSENQLWIGGNEGLGLLDLKTQKFKLLGKEIFGLLPNDRFTVVDIIQDKEKKIWISTNTTGIFCLEKKKDWVVRSLNTSTGMPDNNTSQLVLDKNGHIWAGTTVGMVRIIPETFNITTFTVNDGLGFSNRSGGAKYAMSNGYVLLGANRNYEFFHPDSLISHPSGNMKPYIYSFNVVGTKTDYYSEINYGRKIVLPYNLNRFESELGMLDFTPNRKIQYEYRLVGYDKDWIKTGTRNYIVYSNIPPGNYELEYTAINLNNIAAQKIINRIPIVIQAPWWQQAWFITLYTIALAAIVWLVYHGYKKRKENRRQQEERERNLKEMNRQMNEMRLMAIRSQMNPHFIFNCLNSIQKMIVVEDVNGAYQYLSKFSKLLRMVLDNSEKNFIPLSNEMEMNSLYFELESLRFKKSFEYKIEIDESIDPDSTQVPSLLLQPFIENAIWHGLMHKEGEKRLWVHFFKQNDQLVCTIEDNGVGREYSAAIKTQKLGSHYFESKGSRLSEQRIELLNQQLEGRASIKISDLKNGNEAKGTRVTIELPLQTKTNHLDKDPDHR